MAAPYKPGVTPPHQFEQYVARGNTKPPGPAGPLSVVLDTTFTGGRTAVEVWVQTDRPGSFLVYGSVDGLVWRRTDEIKFTGGLFPRDAHRGYMNAYRFLKVENTTAGAHEAEVVASR